MRRFVLLASITIIAGCGDNNGNGSPDLSTGGGDDLSIVGGDDLAGTGDGGVDGFMCTPGAAISCANNIGTVCNSTGDGTTTAACVTLKAGGNTSMCADGTTCQQCAGANVCGAGANSNTSYTCSAGVLGGGTACKFGCDPSSGLCRDMVPSNQGGGNVAGGDTFTCTGTQDGTLAAVSASTGDTLTFDTSAMTIKVVNGATTTDYTTMSKWGTAYKPTGSGTTAIVAHVKSVSAMNGAKVVVTGANALIVLVDQGVTLSGAAGTPTVVSLNGHFASNTATSGPGGPTTTTGGLGTTAAAGMGGGGAGHGTDGAAGGGALGQTSGGAAGMAYGASILEAGTGGGGGTLVNSAAGGALQVSACGTISIDANVIINASGGAGAAGGGTDPTSLNKNIGGVGGGSGGTIVLEASSFTGNAIPGKLAANGAGGGGGGDSTNVGAPGGEWDPTMAVTTVPMGGAPGTGTAMNPAAGKGGNGGVAGTAPTVGANVAAGANNGGGGGGGAVGRIFVNRAPSATAPTASAASPAPVIGCVGTSGSAVTCP